MEMRKSFWLPPSCPMCEITKKFSTSKVLPCVRDETSILESCLIPVFRCQGVRNHTCFHDTVPTVPPDTASFEQICLYLAFFRPNLRYVQFCCTQLQEFFVSLLLNQFCDIYIVMNMAYVLVFRRQWKSLPHTSRNVVLVMAPMNTHPQLLLVGGGACKGIVWSSIESFVYSSLPYSIDTRGKVLYTAHVDHKGLLRFPAEKYVYACPLPILWI